jgi:hypothetical protein
VHYIKQILQITLRYSLCLVVFITTLKFSYQLNWTDYGRFDMTSHWLTIAFIVDNSWIFETSSFSYHFKLQGNRFFKRVDFIGCEKCVGTNQNILRWHWYNSYLQGFVRQLKHGWWVESIGTESVVGYRRCFALFIQDYLRSPLK